MESKCGKKMKKRGKEKHRKCKYQQTIRTIAFSKGVGCGREGWGVWFLDKKRNSVYTLYIHTLYILHSTSTHLDSWPALPQSAGPPWRRCPPWESRLACPFPGTCPVWLGLSYQSPCDCAQKWGPGSCRRSRQSFRIRCPAWWRIASSASFPWYLNKRSNYLRKYWAFETGKRSSILMKPAGELGTKIGEQILKW